MPDWISKEAREYIMNLDFNLMRQQEMVHQDWINPYGSFCWPFNPLFAKPQISFTDMDDISEEHDYRILDSLLDCN